MSFRTSMRRGKREVRGEIFDVLHARMSAFTRFLLTSGAQSLTGSFEMTTFFNYVSKAKDVYTQ